MGYHHGDLREALVQSAIALIAEAGPAGLSLRKVAIQAGVSHAAPYHHFKDKEALLAAVCEHGFVKLTAAMATATHDDPFERVHRMGQAYMRFALSEPDLYRFMFSTAVPDKNLHPELMQCAHGTFQLLVDAIADCVATGEARPGHPVMLATQVWSMTHGLASLMSDDMVDKPVSESGATLDPEALIEHYLHAVSRSFRR